MDSRLFIEINIDKNTFQAIDNSPYERWIEDGDFDNNHGHLIINRLVAVKDGEDNDTKAFSKKIGNTLEDFKNPFEVQDVYNGLYYYQKLLIPSYEHTPSTSNIRLFYTNENTVTYFDGFESHDYNITSQFDDIYDIIRTDHPDNCFYFDDYSFNIYSLMECYLLTERERLNSYLSNNCGKGCKTSFNLEQQADLLLAAIVVINDLLEKGEFFEAQRVLNALDTCGNLCPKNSSNSINTCGCGGS